MYVRKSLSLFTHVMKNNQRITLLFLLNSFRDWSFDYFGVWSISSTARAGSIYEVFWLVLSLTARAALEVFPLHCDHKILKLTNRL